MNKEIVSFNEEIADFFGNYGAETIERDGSVSFSIPYKFIMVSDSENKFEVELIKKQPDFLSPVKEEREIQEHLLKKLFPGYPDEFSPWQYMNTLIMLALVGCKLNNEAPVETEAVK